VADKSQLHGEVGIVGTCGGVVFVFSHHIFWSAKWYEFGTINRCYLRSSFGTSGIAANLESSTISLAAKGRLVTSYVCGLESLECHLVGQSTTVNSRKWLVERIISRLSGDI
jgi:hypothetical protein